MKDNFDSKITIGLPVYNGEEFLYQRIESILSQTFQNYTLIISDNSSTDSTSKICKEFISKDTRIRYFRQKNNIGPIKNFKYVLDQAETEFFVWAGVDDIWLPEFLEVNIKILENNKKFVGSIGKIDSYGKKVETKPRRFLKKARYVSYENYPKSGNYEDQISFYLKLITNENIYSVFRTMELKKSFVDEPIGLVDKAIILKILRFGEINIIDKVLMYRYSQGFSRTASLSKRLDLFYGYGFLGRLVPSFPFTFWCLKNLGVKMFFKNIDFFIYYFYGKEKNLLKYLIGGNKK